MSPLQRVSFFTRNEIIYSLKSFSAAMLALYLSSRAGLPNTFWSLMTVYVVSQPLAGMVRSKALYRILGTFAGSTATVFMIPSLSNAPVLLTLAMALWVSLCLFVSLLDRTPKAYAFMLAGYTAALIGFPTVQHPETIFITAVSRVEEICLGILCATLVHSVVLPAGLAGTITGLMDKTLNDIRRWLADIFSTPDTSENDRQSLSVARLKLSIDITQLRLMSTHIPFDTSNLKWTSGAVRAMQDRIAELIPTLSAVEDRLQALYKAEGGWSPDILAVQDAVSRWLAAHALLTDTAEAFTATSDSEPLDELRQKVLALETGGDASDWSKALRLSLVDYLDDLMIQWQSCLQLRRDIDIGLQQGTPPNRRQAFIGNRVLHRDVGMALLSALSAFIAICLCCLFWITTGWADGATAAMMAAVFCSFFAVMDDPVPAINMFLKFTLWSVPISALYILVLLPSVQDFGMLVLVCAPLFIILGCYSARPAMLLIALPLLFGVAGTLSLHDTARADLTGFINITTAQLLGTLLAARVTRLMRSVGADWSARRIRKAIRQDLVTLAGRARAQQLRIFAIRMVDRIGLVVSRIAQSEVGRHNRVARESLRDLRLGVNIIALQHIRRYFPMVAFGALLAQLAELFRDEDNLPKPELLIDIDTALKTVLDQGRHYTPHKRTAITALVGIRHNLFPDAPAFLMTPGVNA
ncbi:FUSC family protein [Biostraticola tofi]|uniref:Putative membrane protein YccC n=1 Tax=Biostraticola tofi TaxID=466109 RepID=A0A4R3YZ11_9GAMM|nr:FUSC family protein [Biostraticola tofi]TCV96623.1 putative membrane protein YccC [Biostraticola tofi]